MSCIESYLSKQAQTMYTNFFLFIFLPVIYFYYYIYTLHLLTLLLLLFFWNFENLKGEHPNQHRLNELNSTQSSSSSMFGGISELGTQAEQYSDRAMLFVIISACMGCISSFCASVTVKLLTVRK